MLDGHAHRAFTSTGAPAVHASISTIENDSNGRRRDERERRRAAEPHFVASSTAPTVDDVGMRGSRTSHRPDARRAASGPGSPLLVAGEAARRAGACPCRRRHDRDRAGRAASSSRAPHAVRRRRRRCRVDAEADDDLRLGDRDRKRSSTSALGLAPCRRRGRAAASNTSSESGSADRGSSCAAGWSTARSRDERQSDDGRVVQVRRERDEVGVARTDRVDQVGCDRALLVDPVVLLAQSPADRRRITRSQREASKSASRALGVGNRCTVTPSTTVVPGGYSFGPRRASSAHVVSAFDLTNRRGPRGARRAAAAAVSAPPVTSAP